MLYQPTAEKTTMIQPLTVEHFTRNPEVKKTRLTLIIVLSIQLVFIAIPLLVLIVVAASYDSVKHTIAETSPIATKEVKVGIIILIISAVIVIFFFIAYIMAVVQYNRTLILILAWITVGVLFLGFFIEIREIIILFSAANEGEDVDSYVVVSIISLAINVILMILTIIFSFKLAKLIGNQRSNQIV